MGNKRKWGGSLAVFICSIVPLVPVAVLVALCLILGSVDGEAEAMATLFLTIFVGYITAGVMMIMGMISVVFGTIAIRKPETRGKTLAIVAVVLGILEIGTVICLFIYLFFYLRSFPRF